MNELAKIAEESGLPQTKSQALLEIFQEYFGIAAEWEEQAKSIKVTDESQTELMLKAREGRKFLQEARINLEKTRVAQKQFALLEGRAIDGMANVLKASIVPVEQYLKEQEDFVVNKKKAEALARQEQAMKDLEAKEAAEEKKLQDEIEKERLEKEKELKEAKEKQRLADIERDKAIADQLKIEESARIAREAHQREIEQKQRENFEREEKIRVENEKAVAAEKAARELENERRNKKIELKNKAGKARQELLAKIDIHFDFQTCADMIESVWGEFYEGKKKEYDSKQNKIFVEKLRTEREEKEKKEKVEAELKALKEQAEKDKQILLEKERAEKAVGKVKEEHESGPPAGKVEEFIQPALKGVNTKCPECGHVFNPKLL